MIEADGAKVRKRERLYSNSQDGERRRKEILRKLRWGARGPRLYKKGKCFVARLLIGQLKPVPAFGSEIRVFEPSCVGGRGPHAGSEPSLLQSCALSAPKPSTMHQDFIGKYDYLSSLPFQNFGLDLPQNGWRRGWNQLRPKPGAILEGLLIRRLVQQRGFWG